MRFPALILALFPAAAAADWAYDPGPMPAGRATAPGSGGLSVMVECGNGGFPGFFINGHDPQAAEEVFVVEVDERGEMLLGADCQGTSCMLSGFETMDQMFTLVRQLKAGSVLKLGLYRRGMLGEVSLRGSSAALSAIEARGCEM